MCQKHAQRLYGDWSDFASDLRAIGAHLSSLIMSFLDCTDGGGEVSACMPGLIALGDEARLPLPDEALDEYMSTQALMKRALTEQQLSIQWSQQCPRALGHVCAAIRQLIDAVRIQHTLAKHAHWIR